MVVALTSMLGGTADAQTPCEATIARFAADHSVTYGDAYVVDVVCVPEPPLGNRAGAYRAGHVEIWEHVPGGVASTVAHEVGHAWQIRYAPDLEPYAAIRGFPAGTDLLTLKEDYAETFAYALGGDWSPLAGVQTAPPYRFQNVAGVPTAAQLIALWAAGLLPEVPWGAVSAVVPDP